MASCISFEMIAPDSGTYALVIALANVTMSGWTPQWRSANQRPVRPKPVITSSAMNRTL
jgi:hypothetical protein